MKPWSSREELEAAVADYQANWWRTNDAALSVINDRVAYPGLRSRVLATSSQGQAVITAEVYRHTQQGAPVESGYLPQRQLMHDAIVQDCVPSRAAPASAPSGQPVAYFTIGCFGAGKTTVLRSLVEQHRAQVATSTGDAGLVPYSIIDADRVRQMLPEYADGLGAVVVAVECYDLTYGQVFEQALARRADIVYDTVGRLSSIRDYLERLVSAGYAVQLLHAQADIAACRDRAERRALEVDGRLVAPALFEQVAAESEETLAALRRERFPLAGWAQVNTTNIATPALVDGSACWSSFL